MTKSWSVFLETRGKILDTFELIAQYLGQQSIVWFLNWLLLQIISMTKIFASFHMDKFVTFCNSALLESCEKILDTFQSRCTRKKRKHSRRWPRFVQSDWKRGKNNLSIKNQRIRLEYCQRAGGLKTWLISLKMLGHKTYKEIAFVGNLP